MSYPVSVYGPILNQSLSQYWSVLEMCVTFCEHQITQATVTHACFVGLHENASMAEYSLHRCGVAGTQYMRLTKCCWHLNWSLLRMASTLAFCIFLLE